MNQKQRQARERLERDVRDALTIGAARFANGYGSASEADTGHRLKLMLHARDELVEATITHLLRNWRISERARGERSA